MQNGGICSVFELIDHFIKALEKQYPNLVEEFVSCLVPEAISSLESPFDTSLAI
jgi:hypothetical protein